MGSCASAPRLKVNLRAFIAANPPTDGYGDEWYFDTMNVLLDRWAYSHVQFLRRKFLEATGDRGDKELDKKGFFKLFGELQDMPKAVADSSFRMFDTDNSGKLNFREFCCALALCCLLMSSDDEKISFVFDMFDTNDDGLLSGSDVQLLLEYALSKEDAKSDSAGEEKDSRREQRITDIKQELLANSQHVTFERFYEWAVHNLDCLNNLLQSFQIVPSPERERAVCEDILARNQSLQEGSTWYCISHKWLQIWKAHADWMGPSPGRRVVSGQGLLVAGSARERAVSGDSFAVDDDAWSEDRPAFGSAMEPGAGGPHRLPARPPEIDNSDLEGEHKGELKMNLVEHLDYELIPEEMWLKLVEWYGGGPAIMRKVICMCQDSQPQVELYPPLVLVVVAGESGQPLPQFSRRFFISRQSSLEEVLQMLAEKLARPVERSRLWHRVKGEQWRLLRQMDSTLEEFLDGKVWDAGAFLLESQTVAGRWPRDEPPEAVNAQGPDQELQTHFEVGDRVEAQSGVTNQWTQGTVVDVIQRDHSAAPSQVKVHYDSTVYKSDEWISTDSGRLAPIDTHTRGAKASKGGAEGAPAVRGATGLQNLGNTCFMNATIQCVANTPLLREYFLSSQHLRDMSEKGGARGRLAEEFGNVMAGLWSGKSASFQPRNLKRTIDQIAPYFAGYEQHDAQELLAFVLDRLHDDLNRNAQAAASGQSGRGPISHRRDSGTPKLFKTMATRGGGAASSAPSSPKRGARQAPAPWGAAVAGGGGAVAAAAASGASGGGGGGAVSSGAGAGSAEAAPPPWSAPAAEWPPPGERRPPPPPASGAGPRRAPRAEDPPMRSLEATAAEGAYIDDEDGPGGCPPAPRPLGGGGGAAGDLEAAAAAGDDVALPWDAPLPPPAPPKPPLLQNGLAEGGLPERQEQPPPQRRPLQAGGARPPARPDDDRLLGGQGRCGGGEEAESEAEAFDPPPASSGPAAADAQACSSAPAGGGRRSAPPAAAAGEQDKRTGASRWWSFAWGRGRGALDLPKEHIGNLDFPKENSETLSTASKEAPAAAGGAAGPADAPSAPACVGPAAAGGQPDAGLGSASPPRARPLEEPRPRPPPSGAAGAAAAAVRARDGAEASDDGMASALNESEDFIPELLHPQRASYRRSRSLFSLGWRRRRPEEVDAPGGSPNRRPRTATPPAMSTLQEERAGGGSADAEAASAEDPPADADAGGAVATPPGARQDQTSPWPDSRAGRAREKEGSAWPSFLRRSKSRDGGRRTQPTPSRPPPAPHQGDFPIAEGAAAAEPSEGGGGSSAAGEEASAGAVAERPAGQRTWTLWRREPPAGRGASPSTSAVQVSLPGRPAGDDGSQPSKDAADPGNGSEEDCAGDKDGLAPDEREGDSLQCEEPAGKEGTDEVDESNLPDDEKAALQWERHRAQNRSPIVDVFEGQLRSLLTCGACGAQSSTFETFRYLSVPIPSDHVDRAVLRVVFFPLPFSRPAGDERPQLTRYAVTVPKSGTVGRVERALAGRLPVPMSHVLLAEVYRSRIHRYLGRDLPLSDIRAEDQLFAFEVLQTPQELVQYQERHAPSRPVSASSSRRSASRPPTPDEDARKKQMPPRVLLIQAMHRRVVDVCRSDGRTWAQRREVFGLPFVMSAASTWSYATLHEMLMLHAQRFLRQPGGRGRHSRERAQGPGAALEERQVPFVARIVNASGTACGACDRRNCTGCLLPKGSARLRLRAALLSGAASTAKIYLALDWVDSAIYDQEYVDSAPDAPPAESGDDPARPPRPEGSVADGPVREGAERAEPPTVPVAACIDAFAQPEELKVDLGNGVRCEKCGKVANHVKTLQIWREPDVLILHVKRFHFSGVHFEKLNTPVDLPFRELSLRPWIVGPSASTAAPYELYGVACHRGGMSGGHYTSFCMNTEGKEPTWLKFNDETVTTVSISQEKSELSTQCYVLFYRKRAFSSSNLINYSALL